MGWPAGWDSLDDLPTNASHTWANDPADTGETPRTTTGCADRRARLKALGNGQVPQCAAEAFAQLVTRAFLGS